VQRRLNRLPEPGISDARQQDQFHADSVESAYMASEAGAGDCHRAYSWIRDGNILPLALIVSRR
jgi:hypothetical protein